LLAADCASQAGGMKAKNSHQPLRRRERVMQCFRRRQTLERFASVHSSVFNHFENDRHLNRRDVSKANRDAALAAWRQLGAD
jgi:putative transposase